MSKKFVLELGHAGLYTEDNQNVREYVHRGSPRELTILHRSTRRRWLRKELPSGNYVECADDNGFKYYILDVPIPPPVETVASYRGPQYNGLDGPISSVAVLKMGVNPASFWSNDTCVKHGDKWILYHDRYYYTMLNVKEGVMV